MADFDLRTGHLLTKQPLCQLSIAGILSEGEWTVTRAARVAIVRANQEFDSAFFFRPSSTDLNVLRIAPLIIGPTTSANRPRASNA